MLRKMVQTDEDNTTPTSVQEGDVEDGVLTRISARIALKEVPPFYVEALIFKDTIPSTWAVVSL